jgi:non-ribosomal peptide synthetase component F
MPVPVGVVGELYIAGEGLARGYLNRPDLTAERFVTPASESVPENRLYRTGDLVKYMKTGEIEYQGRNDDQLKVRGYRIDPGEVRAALLTVDGIEDALVAARSAQDGEMYADSRNLERSASSSGRWHKR